MFSQWLSQCSRSSRGQYSRGGARSSTGLRLTDFLGMFPSSEKIPWVRKVAEFWKRKKHGRLAQTISTNTIAKILKLGESLSTNVLRIIWELQLRWLTPRWDLNTSFWCNNQWRSDSPFAMKTNSQNRKNCSHAFSPNINIVVRTRVWVCAVTIRELVPKRFWLITKWETQF
jgi:hypothetical protein